MNFLSFSSVKLWGRDDTSGHWGGRRGRDKVALRKISSHSCGVEGDKWWGQDKDTALLQRGRKWTDWKAAKDLKRQKIWKELLSRRRDGGIRRWKNKPVGSGEIKLDRRQRWLSEEGGRARGRENGLLGKWPSSLLVMGCKSAPCTFSGSRLSYQHSHTWFKKLSRGPKCAFNSGQGTRWQTKRGGTCTNSLWSQLQRYFSCQARQVCRLLL